jgi:sec-independent protein translocase protein TatB
MLDFGFSEILLTSAIALVVLGPERLPKVARQVGNWMGRARLMARQLSEQLEREVNAEELLRQQINIKADQPPLNPPLTPPPAESLAAAPPPAPIDSHHDAERTSVAAMHPVTPAPTSVDPSTRSNE